MNIRERTLEIIKRLKKEYPELKTALGFKTPFELLVATILSAQTTDILVNKVTENIFKKYKSVKEYADASLETLQKDLSSINFYKTKAKNIQGSAKIVVERFNSKVPKTMDELTSLPGVARKTANIILSNAYGINEGIAVDTHVKRLAYRLGLTKNEDPVKIEKDLMPVTPKEEWGNLSHLLIFHGRKICQAKKPGHRECVLYDICPSRNI
ncbi:MAG: endonuclease III [Nitrospirae bacterium CG_4_10_14_0_8_um_filter_41_23]|nr:MAG: endonuclease III [Nitrospirae bacterium CG11_big_fil_rev_8_21_14_0_20_41_14]PIV44828.1 MAG: endonuclease III [Nitrospirae bacterium CG02_land_8_20_14_3_00_41_53]PIW86576.1 MAG: endonuclease III [Nitrospirae bacterium CG_4_8_14_3_um_filter_41_47]PIY86679.1 MAG: endonuclease III [Nitrospirae bacterium CG_4_10_14_0_8_um_filter_41_23]PJA80595.1 MAG: endonuclease III [Nitrospirae bacterium CG_4_9_14_3_um_filter_41_27]